MRRATQFEADELARDREIIRKSELRQGGTQLDMYLLVRQEPKKMIPRKQLEEIAAVVQGVPVWGCLKGSPSEDAGVRYGDIVLVVNGMRTTNIDDYLAARKLRTDGVELEILRDGKELTLYLAFRAANNTSMDELAEKVVEGRFLGLSTPLDADKGLPN